LTFRRLRASHNAANFFAGLIAHVIVVVDITALNEFKLLVVFA
jgi:hypothetical protein